MMIPSHPHITILRASPNCVDNALWKMYCVRTEYCKFWPSVLFCFIHKKISQTISIFNSVLCVYNVNTHLSIKKHFHRTWPQGGRKPCWRRWRDATCGRSSPSGGAGTIMQSTLFCRRYECCWNVNDSSSFQVQELSTGLATLHEASS